MGLRDVCAHRQVWLGKDGYGWSKCHVIEGACSVDCGSMRRIVCETSAFVPDAIRDDPTSAESRLWQRVR